MEKPRIAAKQPEVLTLEQGTYYWCQCGRSRDQPFCDGSHQGTGIEPVEFTIDENERSRLVPVQADQDSAVLRRHAPDAVKMRSERQNENRLDRGN